MLCANHLPENFMNIPLATFARKVSLMVGLSAAIFAGCAAISSTPALVADGVLTGPNGMTLYTFDNDTLGAGKSVCNGPCATNWPPLMAADSDRTSGDFSIITRDDGKKQWASKGKPLYFWAKDSKPGDRTGNGFNKIWQVAKP